ncbi:MAG: 6-bladed beta-propeller [Acidobacteriota bacterium]|jgi:hypothetical protein
MNVRAFGAVVIAAVIGAACAPVDDTSGAERTWVGTITTEGGVTTVVNESGSVWGSTATLVEEASIGVESGADEYMLGAVYAVHGSDDYIYLIDGQLNVVRRYDEKSVFVDQIGRIGQGPGEYTAPRMIEVASDGRIFVWDSDQRRLVVFAADGTPLDTWATNGAFCCVYPIFFDPDAGDNGDALWLLTYSFDRETRAESFAMQAWGPEGSVGPEFSLPDMGAAQERMAEVGGRRFVMPFAPIYPGEVVGPARYAAADFDAYRYEVQVRGETTLVVEKYWDPVPVDPEQADWERRATIARLRGRYPDFTWDGAGMPDHYPPYARLLGSESGEVWAVRNAPGVRVEDCVEDPLAAAETFNSTPAAERSCWQDVYVADVFDPEGRFLGEVETPPGAFTYPYYEFATHIDGDRVVMAVEDEAGVVRVKRYRLVPPRAR